MGVVKLCYNDQKAEKSGGGSNYVAMIFLVNQKKVRKLMGVVKLCWNDFPSNLQHFTFSRGIWQLKQFVSISICTFR